MVKTVLGKGWFNMRGYFDFLFGSDLHIIPRIYCFGGFFFAIRYFFWSLFILIGFSMDKSYGVVFAITTLMISILFFYGYAMLLNMYRKGYFIVLIASIAEAAIIFILKEGMTGEVWMQILSPVILLLLLQIDYSWEDME